MLRLGFYNDIYTLGFQESRNVINILSINSLLVNLEYYITISANSNTLKSVLILENNYQVDFRHPNSISRVLRLGFYNDIYTLGFQESRNVINILSINSLLVNLDIISGRYVNSSSQNTIYSFFPNVSPGYKIVESPINLVYLPITLDTIHSLETSITDQTGNQLKAKI